MLATTIENATADASLAQYGIVGGVVAIVLGSITVPLLRAMIAQNAQALKTNSDAVAALRLSVDANTKAVESFSRVELEHRESRAETRAAFSHLGSRIDDLEDTLAKP